MESLHTRLRASEIYSDNRFVLIAIEGVDFRFSATNTGYQTYGAIKPHAIIICSAVNTYALDIEANPTDLESLRQKLPELDAIIAPFIKKFKSNIKTVA